MHQLTFQRGNYTGHWVEGSPGSGSLEILFKGKLEATLYDKAEHAAEKVFTIYVEPDHHHLAEQIVDAFLHKDVAISDGLKAVADDDRHIQHDVYVVRQILESLKTNEG